VAGRFLRLTAGLFYILPGMLPYFADFAEHPTRVRIVFAEAEMRNAEGRVLARGT